MVLVLASFGPKVLFVVGLLGQARSRDATGAVGVGADLCLVIGDPVPHFEFHHFAFALGFLEDECGVQCVGGLLVIVKHEVPAHGGHLNRETHPQVPSGRYRFRGWPGCRCHRCLYPRSNASCSESDCG